MKEFIPEPELNHLTIVQFKNSNHEKIKNFIMPIIPAFIFNIL